MYSMYSVHVKFPRSESSAGCIAAGAQYRAHLQYAYRWRDAGAMQAQGSGRRLYCMRISQLVALNVVNGQPPCSSIISTWPVSRGRFIGVIDLDRSPTLREPRRQSYALSKVRWITSSSVSLFPLDSCRSMYPSAQK